MKTLIAATAVLAMIAATQADAAAEVFTYACHRPDDFKLYTAKLDLTKKTITWNGTVYRNGKRLTELDGNECPKFCFRAISRDGVATLSTATQGVASLTVAFGGPGTDDVDEVECDVLRK